MPDRRIGHQPVFDFRVQFGAALPGRALAEFVRRAGDTRAEIC
ncbi:hypothetical protein [Bradyrhizobium sp. URHD0069]|nr:hypothetical protein [Bradyrhizobium sp. URHD0069]